MNKALFLDRDGILNEATERDGQFGSPRAFSDLELIEDAKHLVIAAKKLNYLTVVITNQPDLGRKKMDAAELEKMHDLLRKEFLIDGIEICISGVDSDYRRKPNPGMLLDAARKHRISLKDSFFLGDGQKDIIAGRKAGVRTILLETHYNSDIHGMGDYNCKTTKEVINLLRNEEASKDDI